MKRVPFLAQMTPSDCGPTCLAMVAQYYGLPHEPESIRQSLGHSPHGITLAHMARFAEKENLKPKIYEVSQVQRFDDLSLPLILFWKDHHFVVLERVKKGQFHIVDPESGRLILNDEAFKNSFSGLALGLAIEPQKTWITPNLKILGRYLKKVWMYPKKLANALGLSVVLKGLGLVLPFITALVLDRILPQADWSLLTWVGWGLVAFLVAQFGFGLLRHWVLIDLQARTDKSLIQQFSQHLLSLPFAFFQARPVGDLVMRLNSLRTIRDLFANQVLTGFIDGVLAMIYFAFMLKLSPPLAAIVGVIALAQMITSITFFRIMDERVKIEVLAQSKHQSFAVETLNAIQSLKASGLQSKALNKWHGLVDREIKKSIHTQRLGALLQSIQQGLSLAGPIAILWLGSYYILNGQLSVGTVLAFNVLTGSFLGPLSSLIGCVQQFQVIGSHLLRLDDILKQEPESEDGQKKSNISGAISAKGLSFSYQQGIPALKDIQLEVQAGEFIGIVGPSGSGKSTLVKILAGLFHLDKGEVGFDGVPLQQWHLNSLRQQMGSVFQESALVEGNLAENIAFYDELDFERVHEAAHLACISTNHHMWWRGYETPIGHGGGTLSGGQRQRILLARALYRRPRLLILDEATSQVDPGTERIILSQLKSLGMTCLVVTHRLETLKNADRILVLEQGQIVEEGPPQSLFQTNTRFSQLVGSTQSQLV